MVHRYAEMRKTREKHYERYALLALDRATAADNYGNIVKFKISRGGDCNDT